MPEAADAVNQLRKLIHWQLPLRCWQLLMTCCPEAVRTNSHRRYSFGVGGWGSWKLKVLGCNAENRWSSCRECTSTQLNNEPCRPQTRLVFLTRSTFSTSACIHFGFKIRRSGDSLNGPMTVTSSLVHCATTAIHGAWRYTILSRSLVQEWPVWTWNGGKVSLWVFATLVLVIGRLLESCVHE